jgi:hypothetical protein
MSRVGIITIYIINTRRVASQEDGGRGLSLHVDDGSVDYKVE